MSSGDALSAFDDPVVGVVRRCVELPLAPDDPAVFAFVSEATRPARFRTSVPTGGRFGCGVDVDRHRARAAALGEIVERYSAAFTPRQALRRGSFRQVSRREDAVPPERFALFSRRQYRQFADWRLRSPGDGEIPYPFDRDTPTAWIPGVRLATGRPILVPAALVFLPHRYAPGEPFLLDGLSTGLACGRSRDEATLGALYEVVERDVLAILWHARLSPPVLEVEQGSELDVLMGGRFAGAGRWVLLDATLDLPIPTVLAVWRQRDGGLVLGSSTRLDPRQAARKALLEAVQGRVVWRRELVAGPGRVYRDDGGDVRDFGDHPHFYMDPRRHGPVQFLWSSPSRRSLEAPAPRPAVDTTARIAEDLATCVGLLREAGLEPIAVDVTSDDVRGEGLWVVRVVIPGLQPLHARHDAPFLGGERLRSVPHRLGLRSRVLREDELNRDVHPFP